MRSCSQRSQRRQIWMSALVFWLRTLAATRLPSATFWRHCLAWRVKSFKLWLRSQGEKQEVSNCMLEQMFIRLVLRSILTFTTTTSWATTVFPWLHNGDAEAFAKVPDRGPSARIGRPGYWWQMSRFVQWVFGSLAARTEIHRNTMLNKVSGKNMQKYQFESIWFI